MYYFHVETDEVRWDKPPELVAYEERISGTSTSEPAAESAAATPTPAPTTSAFPPKVPEPEKKEPQPEKKEPKPAVTEEKQKKQQKYLT